MRQYIPFRQFTRALFDNEREADQTAQILQAILARPARPA